MRSFGTAVFCLLTVSTANMLFAQSQGSVAQPGAVVIEPPTTGALGVEWRIRGDDNRNASVAVAWRRAGETAWRDGLPLLRLQTEAVQQGASEDYDFTLAAGSGAIDAGTVLPGVTDGFAGRAPDLGALESGRAVPAYGPRPLADQP
jgi:hypothetical protein